MKIISFNILSDQLVYPELCAEEYKGVNLKYIKFKYRLTKIVEYLQSLDPDIILLQEVDPVFRKFIVKEMPLYKTSPVVEYYQNKNSTVTTGVMTMIRKKFATSITFIKKIFSKYEVGYSITTCKVGYEQLVVCNIHLSDVSETIRLNQTRELMKVLTVFIKNKTKIIISGDFNTDSTIIHKIFKQNGFEPAIKKTQKKSTYLCTNQMIDYIYVNNLKVVASFVGHNDEQTNNKQCVTKLFKTFGSDHFPIYCEASM